MKRKPLWRLLLCALLFPVFWTSTFSSVAQTTDMVKRSMGTILNDTSPTTTDVSKSNDWTYTECIVTVERITGFFGDTTHWDDVGFSYKWEGGFSDTTFTGTLSTSWSWTGVDVTVTGSLIVECDEYLQNVNRLTLNYTKVSTDEWGGRTYTGTSTVSLIAENIPLDYAWGDDRNFRLVGKDVADHIVSFTQSDVPMIADPRTMTWFDCYGTSEIEVWFMGKVERQDEISLAAWYPHPRDKDYFFWEDGTMRPGQKWRFLSDVSYTLVSADSGRIEMKIVNNKGEVFDEAIIEPVYEGIGERINDVLSEEITIPHTEDIDTLYLKFYLIPAGAFEPTDSVRVIYRYFIYEWNFMVYMDGDGDLESAALNDLGEMWNFPSNDSVAIVVLFDRHPGYDNGWGNWTNTRLYFVKFDASGNVRFKNVGELNMGCPNTLLSFIHESMREFPARRHVLVLWDHGDGWMEPEAVSKIPISGFRFPKLPPKNDFDDVFKEVIIDETSNDRLYSAEIRAVLNSTPPLDILGIDACLNAMVENVYQYRNGASYFIASEHVVPNAGWPYGPILQKLKERPEMETVELAELIVREYGASYDLARNKVTCSATDFSKAGSLKDAVNTLAEALIEKKPWDEVTTALNLTKSYHNLPYRDLYHFAELLKATTQDDDVYRACNGMMSAINEAVVENYHSLVYEENSHGLTIYFPKYKNLYCDKYDKSGNISLSDDAQWDEFLKLYLWRTTPPNTETTTIETAIYDTYEPNETITQAWGPLVPQTAYHSYIPHPDDKDFYFISPGQTTSLSATLTIPGGVDYDLVVYNEFGIIIGQSQTGSSPESLTLQNLPSGPYFIEVVSNGDFVNVPYKLEVDYSGYEMGPVRLSFDDDDPESSVFSANAGDVIGVNMDAPEYPMNLDEVSFNIKSRDGAGTGGDGSFYVWLADFFGTMTDSFKVTPTITQLMKADENDGWFSVDVSDKEIVLQSQFFVGAGYDGQNTPALGVDNIPNGNAYQWEADNDQWIPLDATVFIRAQVSYRETQQIVDISMPDDLQAGPGVEIRAPVLVSNVPAGGIDSLELEISYDADILQLSGISTGATLTGDWQFVDIDTLLKGELAIYMQGGSRILSDGILCELVFTVLPEATIGQFSNIFFDLVLMNGGQVLVEADPGRCTVALGLSIRLTAESSQSQGNGFWLDVEVGDDASPVTDLLGLSFQLNFTQTEYIDVVTPHDANVIPGDFMGGDVIFLQVVDEASGEVGIGITRKAGDGGVDGYGSVARVQFISSAGTPDGTRVDFAVSGVNANDSDGAPISIVPMSKSVTITTTVTAPTFDPLPGTYQSPVDVTLQCATPGATIYYTMDGTAPTQSDIIYSSPIHISETTTLSVRAYKQSMNPSTVAVGTYTIPGTNVESEKSSIPEEYELYQAYPNPFNPSTTISYAIPYSGRAINVELEIYNTLGERVRTLVDGFHEPGVYSVKWDGRDNRGLLVSGGMYLYRLKAGSRSLMKKMLLLR